MKHRFALLIGILVALFLVAYMFAYQVRYDQIVVLTTFDEVSEGSTKTEPGLYLKLPWPIQRAHTFSRLDQLLEDELRELQTADKQNLIIRAFMTWRIDPDNAVDFLVNMQDPEQARDKLRPHLGVKINEVVGQFNLDQIVNTDREQVKLAEMENQALEALRAEMNRLGLGVRIEHLGIRRIVLPQEVTLKVFETMRKTRERLAADASSKGQAEASRITSQAQNAAERIRAFAERRASAIRSEGDMEAARLMASFKVDESLAVFLQWIDTLKTTLANNSTIVLEGGKMFSPDLIRDIPNFSSDASVASPEPRGEDARPPVPAAALTP